MKTADVIIPVYNERENLPLLLRRLQTLPIFKNLNLIFVDNASTDGSVEYLAALPEVLLIKHESNLAMALPCAVVCRQHSAIV
jgi:glycosyltransferase involved in cell wall biosynthesis